MILLDHVTTSTNAASLDDQVQQYRNAKFLRLPHTVPYRPGLRHAFIKFGYEYLELSWIEDWNSFAAEAETRGPEMFAVQPFRVAFRIEDLESFYQASVDAGLSLPSIKELKTQSDAKPFAKMLVLPAEEIGSGVTLFLFEYLNMTKGSTDTLYVAPNKIYALSGLTFVSPTPQKQAQRFCRVFHRAESSSRDGIYQVRLGPHLLQWMEPDRYEALYGSDWHPARKGDNEVALLHLLTDDGTLTREYLQSAKRTCRDLVDGSLFVQADPHDGTAFHISHQPVVKWVNERGLLGLQVGEIEYL